MEQPELDWLGDLGGDDQDDEIQIDEYDLASSPNDFNTLTIVNFIESGAVRIPPFQRNYVWDIKRASRLIESLILGLPVPQVFLYEQSRNDFLVIDGQQRLLTIYFFVKQRFPRKNKRAELRLLLAAEKSFDPELLHDDRYFENFTLRLPSIPGERANQFAKLKYETLGEYKTQFDLRTIRNIIVKQIRPSGDDSSVYEIFHRLNTGGMNLRPQEIRASLYYSEFFAMLFEVNLEEEWRELVGLPDLDVNLRDIEVLLRASAMLQNGSSYSSSMARFLNSYAKQAKSMTQDQLDELKAQLLWFIRGTRHELGDRAFWRSNRFSLTLFEACFRAGVILKREGRAESDLFAAIPRIREDEQFLGFATARSSNKANVQGRLQRAIELMNG